VSDDRQFHALELGAGGPRVYWLDGGGFRLDGGSMFGPVPRPRWSALYPPADDNTVPLTAHVALVETASPHGWGLIDAGFGHHLSDRQRRNYALERETQLDRSLAELGIGSAQVDWIVLSHLHLDHAGGVLGDAGPAFPNAPIWVQSLEAHEARDETNRAHGMYTGDAFDVLDRSELVHEVDGEADIAPGVRVFLTGGHSRGHQATLVSGSEGAALLHLGDLLVTRAHLPAPWVSALDDFPLDSIRAKREWLPRVAQNGWWVALSHDVDGVATTLTSDLKVGTLWRG
jgi:glyoxylase-like metal-dependent hydrolase (beta-lactamase superfamily II)